MFPATHFIGSFYTRLSFVLVLMQCDTTIFSLLLSYDLIKLTTDSKVVEIAKESDQIDADDAPVAAELPS